MELRVVEILERICFGRIGHIVDRVLDIFVVFAMGLALSGFLVVMLGAIIGYPIALALGFPIGYILAYFMYKL